MTKRNTSIRINGRHYDALTGVLLSTDSPVTTALKKPVTHKSIDGVVGGNQSKRAAPIITSSPTVPKPAKVSAPRSAAKHAPVHHVKPSATLMRHVVAKPTTASVKRRAKVQASTHHASHLQTMPAITIVPKASLHKINPQRATRAATTATSPSIARFAHELAITVSKDIEQAASAIDKAIIIPQTSMPSGPYRPDVKRIVTKRQTSDIFEQALLRATSHEEIAPTEFKSSKKRSRANRSLRHRMVSFSAGAVAVLALVGMFGYHGQDNLRFKVASSKAGFSATLPGYQPKGFSVANVQVASGYVNVQYKSPSTVQGASQTFAVTEKPSNWDSETLLTNITASRDGANYSTIQKSGRTVYVYGRNQAAWVNDGILYQVLGNGALSTQEFVEIATSM